MRTQSFAGWRGLALAASLVGLIVVPITGALAGPKPAGKNGPSGFGLPTADDDHAFHQTLYPRSNYLWPFGTGPAYGEQVDTSRWSAPGMLHTTVGSIDMTRGLPAFPAELRTGVKLDKLGAQYFIVQVHPDAFADGSFDRIRDSITVNGGSIVQEMAVAGFIVRLTNQGYASLQGLPGLIALEPYHPAFKLDPTIGRAPLPDPLKALSEVYTLELRLFPGENAQVVAQTLAGLRAGVTQILGNVIVADVHRSKLAQVAALEPVYMVSEQLPNFVQGEETTTTMQTGKWNLGANPYHDAGVRGDGNGIGGTSFQILAVVDSGIQLDAGDLSDTKTNAGSAGVGHRKVVLYTSTSGFGGAGDALGCDAPGSGGFTHGHTVSATALGNATNTPGSYGGSWHAVEPGTGALWDLDGVAPRAKVAAYDAQVTPASLGCSSPGQGGISPGNLYDPPTPGPEAGVLFDAYTNGARVVNFSWGTQGSNTYSGNAIEVDDFLFNRKEAMLFVSAGNGSQDTPANGIWDPTVSNPATCKSCVVVGGTGNANDTGGAPTQDNCYSATSSGPVATSNRVAPILDAPGTDSGSMGIASEYSCRSSDNTQTNPVECDVVQGLSGTSFSSPAAAGAALLVRDFFAQGFYPDGTSTNPGNAADQKTTISGALVKAVLIASAEWVGPGTASGTDPNRPGFNCGGVGDVQAWKYRFNNKQGYGRIQLNRALPLASYASATGLIVADGGIAGGPNNTSLSGTANPSTTETTAINVCDTGQDLSVGLAWVEASGNSLAKDLDLELVAPSGKTYFGNYYTDDEDKDNVLDAGENCDYAGPFPLATTNVLDPYPWSIPTCANSTHEAQNPNEGIHLSADPLANGVLDNPATGTVNEGADNQIELGNWTLRVIGRSFTGGQPYALAVAGPVCIRSSARLQILKKDGSVGTGNFVCNDTAKVIVSEVLDGVDDSINNNAAEISSRTTLKVWGVGTNGTFDGGTGDDVLLDSETGLVFTDTDGVGAGLEFRANVVALTSGTAQDPGNGALDIRSGNFLQVVYQDKTSGVPDANKVRTNSAKVDCQAKVAFGGVVWGQFGRDGFTLVNGGCEQDQRGYFSFGFPDKYMDAGETLTYRIAFSQGDTETLEDAQASLRCVVVDTDSPASCLPGTTDCADPDRTNNATCTEMTITDSPKPIGSIPTGAAVSANFTIRMATAITGTPVIEMVLGVSAQKSGRPIQGLAVSRHTLDVDEVSLFYSTDFPTGGTETFDVDNNESIQNPTTDPVDFLEDYQFETRTWSDLTATGLNTTAALKSPWNFDTSNGGFTVVLDNISSSTVLTTLAQWGEDMNGNGVLDAGEDRDPANTQLDNNWSTNGGCGWETKGAIATGGVWHTGRIDTTTPATCLANGATAARCQRNEVVTGITGSNLWWEMLLTPVFKKVNKCCSGGANGCPVTLPAACVGRTDSTGAPVFQPEFMWLAWNASMDLNDQLTYFTWEVDGDTTKIEPVDLTNDGSILNLAAGKIGAIAGGNAPLFDGYPLFSNISKCQDTDGNGSVDHCGNASGAACTTDAPCTGSDVNGTVGGNRAGDNNCFFEGKQLGVVKAKLPYGLSTPADDDVRNGWCTSSNSSDKSRACTTASATSVCTTPYTTPCNFDGAATVDLYVTANGPGRNMTIEQANGPDMRFTTLEDIYGDSGESFQVAFGFLTLEASGAPPAPQASAGFGVAIDDVKVDWREFRLDKDTTNCDTSVVANRCASVDLQSTNFFDGNALITVTVVDDFPRGGVSGGFNDCNYDGVFTETTTDCDGNGTPDIVARVANDRSALVRDFEVIYLNRVGSTNEYKGTIPISVSYNVPGTLFIVRNGADIPTVTAQYTDYDTGSGQKCKSDQNPSGIINTDGIMEASTAVFPPVGRVSITKVRLTDNGDNDGFADAGETVSAFLTFNNKSRMNLESITATLDTNDSKIQCISSPVVALANLADGQTLEQATPFVFRVSPTANRVGVNDDFSAVFTVTLRSEQFDSLDRSTQFTLDLDLDASGSCTSTSFSEGFEGGTFGQFTSMTLDGAGTADGHRCQYNDPAGPNPNDPGRANCTPGTNITAYDWHVHTTAMNDGGRAYGGTMSLHWGVHPTSGAVDDTAHFQQLDAIRMNDSTVVNLGLTSPIELTFKQQVSLADNRCTNTPDGFAADRFAVSAQLADAGGTGFGPWFKLYAYENQYDRQGVDNFGNCTFDPTDDGNNEDSFFDPTDPLRRLGPSTTCFPEFIYANQGDTDYRNTFVNATSNLGSAEGPGLQGAINRGTWVMPKFNLDRLKGRRMRVRFLATSIEVDPATDETQLGFADNQTCDDGVYIDDVQVSGACTTPLTLAVDTKTPPSTLCGACSVVTAALTANDASLDAPGQAVELSADTSTVDKCVDGVLQFRFFGDTNGNNVFDQGTDTILRDWTDNPVFVDAPTGNSTYGVLVRCSSDTNCGASLTNASAIQRICVTCPSSGALAAGPFAPTIGFTKVSGSNVNVTWSPSSLVDVIRGNLDLLRSSGGNFTGTVQGCLADNFTGTSVNDVTTPSPGSGIYYLVRIAASLCNQQGTWSTGNIKELAGRNLEVNLDCNTCP